MSVFSGLGVALITPLKNNKVDFASLEKQIEKQLSAKTDAIIVLGTTGEPSTLSREEKDKIISFCKDKIKGKSKLVVGCGGNNTKQVILDSLRAKELGADALLIVTPFYNKCTDEGLFLHYETIARCVNLPIILYNVPSRTGVNIKPDVAIRLSKIKNIVGIKEASGNINQILELFNKRDKNFSIYCGEDALNYVFLALGADGLISVSANIAPKHLKMMCSLCEKKEFEKARAISEKLYKLNKNLFLEVNPIPVKTALSLNGEINDEFRLPLCKMGENNKSILKESLTKDIVKDEFSF